MVEPLGQVREVWRYPVKSMIGEQRSAVPLTEQGVLLALLPRIRPDLYDV